MKAKRLWIVGGLVSAIAVLLSLSAVSAAEVPSLTDNEALGKAIFFDEDLSLNKNQSCATCHDPAVGFTGPLSDINAAGGVYEGSVPGEFGDRKPPSAAYATQSPIFHLDKKGTWTGGNFWDGRATGEVLGNPAADQARGPFLNPVEQALPDSACVVYRVYNASYEGVSFEGVSFEGVWGILDIKWPSDVDADCAAGDPIVLDPEDRAKSNTAYEQVALSIAAYEASSEVNSFSSKSDLKGKLTKQEQGGRALFKGRAQCAACHPSNGQLPLFTDYTFDNLGVPANPDNPALIADTGFVDFGLGGFLKARGYPEDVYGEELGKHKVPTVRNVAKGDGDGGVVKAYSHNGYFKTLEGLVHFYNTRDVKDECAVHDDGSGYTEAEALAGNCWPAPEVPENVNDDELGDLGLSPADEAAIVAFLRTLSDGWIAP